MNPPSRRSWFDRISAFASDRLRWTVEPRPRGQNMARIPARRARGRPLLWIVLSGMTLGVSGRANAQTAPVPPSVATQPASQTVVVNGSVTLGVTAAGTPPFSYQWRLNGTNLAYTAVISTVAGNGAPGFSGDGGAAADASLDQPQGVAADGAGNFYLSDGEHGRVRRVATNGVISTVAGNGTTGFSGDGGPATAASLSFPSGVAVDAAGNLFIADELNHRIRKVDTNGVITTVAGNGNHGFSGDGGPATKASLNFPRGVAVDSGGNLYIADESNNRIRRVNTNGVIATVAGNGRNGFSGDGGAATNASLASPVGVAADLAGNLYVADMGNNRVRQVGANGAITTLAGKAVPGVSGDGGAATNAGLSDPLGVAVDDAGNVFVADTDNNRVRKVDRFGVITTLAGDGGQGYSGDGGAATNSSLWRPSGVALDGRGNLYIADSYDNRIRSASAAMPPTLTLTNVGSGAAGNYTVVVTSLFGSATSAVATLTVVFPPTITVEPVNQLAAAGGDATFGVSASGTPPLGFAWHANSSALVQSGAVPGLTLGGVTLSQAGGYSVVVTNAYGSVTSAVATLTVGLPPTIAAPPASQTVAAGASVALSVTPQGTGPFTFQWRFDNQPLPSNPVILTVAGDGAAGFSGDGGPATNASLQAPSDVAADTAGNLFIADQNNNLIRKVDAYGVITTVAGNGSNSFSGDGGPATDAALFYPNGVAVDGFGNLYIADEYNNRIRKVDAGGIITTVAGNGDGGFSGDGGPAANAVLSQPRNVTVDASGNLYISDTGNNRVRRVDAGGVITTVAGNGTGGFSGDGGPAANASLASPLGLAFDAEGGLLIADQANSRVRRMDSAGFITTVAGNGSYGYSGDGGPALGAELSNPSGVALDAAGNLYVTDTFNSRVRLVDTNGVITTVAGSGQYGASGDGSLAYEASLSFPLGVAVDASGNVYFADQNNNRVREAALGVSPTLTLTRVAPINSGGYTVLVSSLFGSITSGVARVTVTVASKPASIVMSAPVIANGGLTLGFTPLGGSSASFSLLQAGSLAGPWATNMAAVLTTNPLTGVYQFSAPLPATTAFYQVRSP